VVAAASVVVLAISVIFIIEIYFEESILTRGEEFEDTPMTENTQWGPGIRSDLAIINNNGDQILYVIEGSWETGIYDLSNEINTILPPAPQNSHPAWDINEENFVHFADNKCMSVTNHSDTYECDYFLNVHDFSGRQPYVNKHSLFCNTHEESVHYGACNFDNEWSKAGKPHQHQVKSYSGNSSFGTSHVTTDEDWFGSDEIDMLMGFTKNINWKIEHNNSTYHSGISYLESSIRLLGNEDSDLINIKWIPQSENLLVLFEEKVSVFSRTDDEGWIEKGSMELRCYDGDNEWAGDNNQIKQVDLGGHYGFIVSENGDHILVYDECNDLYRLELDESKLNIEITETTILDNGKMVHVILAIFLGFVLLMVASKQNLLENSTTKPSVALVCCVIVLGMIPGCLFGEEDLHKMDLNMPEEVNIQSQPFSDEYIATISFDEEVYLTSLDYYFWDGNNHQWGSGGDGESKSFNVPGYCSDENCFSSLKLFWNGIELES